MKKSRIKSWRTHEGCTQNYYLDDRQNDGIKEQIGAGYYTDDSAYIRGLIEQEQEHNAEPRSSPLIEGEHGSEPQPFARPHSRKDAD